MICLRLHFENVSHFIPYHVHAFQLLKGTVSLVGRPFIFDVNCLRWCFNVGLHSIMLWKHFWNRIITEDEHNWFVGYLPCAQWFITWKTVYLLMSISCIYGVYKYTNQSSTFPQTKLELVIKNSYLDRKMRQKYFIFDKMPSTWDRKIRHMPDSRNDWVGAGKILFTLIRNRWTCRFAKRPICKMNTGQ